MDPRQTEGAPLRRGTSTSPPPPPPLSLSRLPAVLMVGLWGAGYKGGKEAKMEKGKKALICFYLTVFELNPGTLGDRC